MRFLILKIISKKIQQLITTKHLTLYRIRCIMYEDTLRTVLFAGKGGLLQWHMRYLVFSEFYLSLVSF